MEFKFRAIAVLDGEWKYGNNIHQVFTNNDNEEYWIISPKGSPIEALEDGYIKHRPLIVVKDTIGQYTGLKDKNSKEVYVGDIVNCSKGCPHEIEIRKYHGGFLGGMPTVYLSELNEGYAWTGDEEVIGNIHENKDLLNS